MAEKKMDLRPNSDKARREEAEQKKPTIRVKQVTSLEHVTRQKKGFFARMFNKYAETDAATMKKYFWQEVVIPGISEIIYNGVTGILEMVLPGLIVKSKKKKGESNVSYTAYYKSSNSNNSRNDFAERNPRIDLDDLIFESSGEAEQVRDQLVDLTTDYQQATVADLYDCVGVTVSDWTLRGEQEKWGWTSLGSARVRKVPGGYKLILPPPEKLS